MAATKRRHSNVLEKPDASGAGTKQREEGNARLISLCVNILSAHHPRGMTTKELIGELDKQTEKIPNLTSSILSTKLNAMFRKSHGDSANPSPTQLAELPLVRRTSTDLPKRLVYTFAGEVPQAPPTPSGQESDAMATDSSLGSVESEFVPELESEFVPELEPESVPESESEPKRQKLDSKEQPTPETSDDEAASPAATEAADASADTEQPTPAASEDESAPAASQQAPASPVSLHEPESHDAAESAQPVPESAVPKPSPLPIPEIKVVERAAHTHFKSRPKEQPHKVNLYYDSLGVDGLTNALPTPAAESPAESAFDLDFTSEFAPPEDLSFELDGFIC